MAIDLEQFRYKRPANYLGPDWDDYYAVANQSRDSDALERANFRAWVQDMESCFELYYDEDTSPPDIDDVFHIIRDSHWAVGWVETLYVNQDAPEEMLDQVRGNLEQLESYSVLDEDLWSEIEREDEEEALENWGFREVSRIYNLNIDAEEDQRHLEDMVYDFLSRDVLRFEHDSGGAYLVGLGEIEDDELDEWFPFKVFDPWDGSEGPVRFTNQPAATMRMMEIVQERHREGDMIELLDFGWTMGFRVAPRVGTWEVVKVVK